jgi:hypothetical protein
VEDSAILLEAVGEITEEFQPNLVSQSSARAVLHAGAAGDEEQLVGAEANKRPNRQLSIRVHERAPGTDISRQSWHGTNLISILPNQNNSSPKRQALVRSKI